MAAPNIILIVSDDHGYADRSCLGHHADVHTPALDRLAATGVSCSNAYVAAPICSPSRGGIISGTHPARWGACWFGTSRFPEHLPTIAERMRGAGYATGYLGKVHYGNTDKPGTRACPPQHGFDDSFYGLAGSQQGRLNYLHHTQQAADDYGPEAAKRMAVLPLYENTTEVEFDGFMTAEIGRRARQFVTDHQTEPFFLMVAFNAVHNFCWQLPETELAARSLPYVPDWTPTLGDYGDWYDDAIAPNLPHGRDFYLAQLELMDAEIGALLHQLDTIGVADDTLVVYTTDNGGSTCNFGDNTPLRGTKYSLWEGGIRVPMIARWPNGAITGGRARGPMISSLDLFPTLLAAAGIDRGEQEAIDGIDQLPLLRDGAGQGHDMLHWTTGWSWAIRSGNLKLSWVDPDSSQAVHVRREQHADIGTGYFLADLAADPGETHNIAPDRPDLLDAMIRHHEQWQISLPSQDASGQHPAPMTGGLHENTAP